jgi:hypothetical protein
VEHTHLANQLSGRAIGSIFFSFFGVVWLGLAFYIRQALTTGTIIGLASLLGVLILTALWLFKQSTRWPKATEDPNRSRAFNRVNAIQWIAVAVIAFSFSKLHLDAYIMSAITAVVGIHLFPLAKLFRYPMHNITGAALVLWASATVLLVPTEILQGITALGTGSVLLTSAAIAQGLAVRAAMRANAAEANRTEHLCMER